MTQSIDAVVSTIKSLPPELRVELLQKLKDVAVDDAAQQFDSVSSATGPGPRRPLLSPMQAAADPRNAPLLRSIKANAARLGFDIKLGDNKPIDTFTLDAAIAGADPTKRIELKCALAQLHLIP